MSEMAGFRTQFFPRTEEHRGPTARGSHRLGLVYLPRSGMEAEFTARLQPPNLRF